MVRCDACQPDAERFRALGMSFGSAKNVDGRGRSERSRWVAISLKMRVVLSLCCRRDEFFEILLLSHRWPSRLFLSRYSYIDSLQLD